MSIIVDMVEKLPLEAVANHVLEVPGIRECFNKDVNNGDPDALFVALKLRKRVPLETEMFGNLLPCPFIPDIFFTRDHLSTLVPCFKERNVGYGLEANKLHALRLVLVQLALQVLLCPEEFYEAASELVICCDKAFLATAAAQGGSSGEGNELDDNEMPDLTDVLLENFLSLLPRSSGSLCFAIEQAFRLFCDDLTIDGVLRMLHVVTKDLKPMRYHTRGSDDDENEDDDFLGIEDMDETSGAEGVKAHNGDDHADDLEKMHGEATDGETKNEEVDSGGMVALELMQVMTLKWIKI
ncbi:uncharacterized protein LOC109823836 isoform X2 [Asparagus officinalis]|nr:uncharacterized protein LOC109823836 isoform X2 [Asparagus officinalis]